MLYVIPEIILGGKICIRFYKQTRHNGSHLLSQHCGRPRRADHLRSGVQDQPGQHDETPSLLKIQKISWAWWHVPVIPATQEAKAGELPEPRKRRLRWAEITLLHSRLGNKSETPSQKKKKKRKEKENIDRLCCSEHNFLYHLVALPLFFNNL